jgi:hypothetical protein
MHKLMGTTGRFLHTSTIRYAVTDAVSSANEVAV